MLITKKHIRKILIENYLNIYSGYKYFSNLNKTDFCVNNYADIIKMAEKYIRALTTLIIKYKLYDESFVTLKREIDNMHNDLDNTTLFSMQKASYKLNKSFEDFESKLSFLICNEEEKQYIKGILR